MLTVLVSVDYNHRFYLWKVPLTKKKLIELWPTRCISPFRHRPERFGLLELLEWGTKDQRKRSMRLLKKHLFKCEAIYNSPDETWLEVDGNFYELNNT